jgi:hypothetical protein
MGEFEGSGNVVLADSAEGRRVTQIFVFVVADTFVDDIPSFDAAIYNGRRRW